MAKNVTLLMKPDVWSTRKNVLLVIKKTFKTLFGQAINLPNNIILPLTLSVIKNSLDNCRHIMRGSCHTQTKLFKFPLVWKL
jgi:hypothetical protein